MRIVIFIFVVGLALSSVRGEAPLRFNYQAKLTDAVGAPLNGTHAFEFSIFSVPTGGAALYTESALVAVSSGVVNHVVGSITPLSLSTFEAGGDLYLEVSIDSLAIVPRMALGSSPFAMRSRSAAAADLAKNALNAEGLGNSDVVITLSATAPVGYSYIGLTVSPTGSGAWAGMAAMPTAREGLATALVNGKIYALGGTGAIGTSATNQEYDLATNTWADRAAMPTARNDLAAVAVDGKIYALGGYTSAASTVNEAYNPATNSWVSRAPLPTASYGLAAAVVNGKVYAIGGGSTVYLADNHEYDPFTNSWAPKAPMPTARYGLAASAVNNKIYAFGGYSGGSNYSAANQEYDPATNIWTAKAAMPTARAYLAAAAVDNKIYAISGSFGVLSAANEEYDPATNTWAFRAAIPTARRFLAATAVNGKIYAFGGFTGTSYSTETEEFTPPDPSAGKLYVHRRD